MFGESGEIAKAFMRSPAPASRYSTDEKCVQQRSESASGGRIPRFGKGKEFLKEVVCQVFFTKLRTSREGWQALLSHRQDRIEAIRPAIERLGGKIKNAWFAFGDHDVILITEMPGNVSAAAISIAFAEGGRLQIGADHTPALYGRGCASNEESQRVGLPARWDSNQGCLAWPDKLVSPERKTRPQRAALLLCASELERKLRGQLNPARPTATEEGIANAHVAGGTQTEAATTHLAVPARSKAIHSRIGDKQWQKWASKVWMIQKIEELRPKLHA